MKRVRKSLLILLFSSSFSWANCPDAGTTNSEMLSFINEFRAQGGTCGGTTYPSAAPLMLNRFLTASALFHAQDMARYNYFSHASQNGSTPTDRIRATGYLEGAAAWATGENIGAGTARNSAWIQFNAWRNSPAHCKSMLAAKYQHMGIACSYQVQATYRHYWTLNLGSGGRI